jgi:hypothetical protein
MVLRKEGVGTPIFFDSCVVLLSCFGNPTQVHVVFKVRQLDAPCQWVRTIVEGEGSLFIKVEQENDLEIDALIEGAATARELDAFAVLHEDAAKAFARLVVAACSSNDIPRPTAGSPA